MAIGREFSAPVAARFLPHLAALTVRSIGPAIVPNRQPNMSQEMRALFSLRMRSIILAPGSAPSTERPRDDLNRAGFPGDFKLREYRVYGRGTSVKRS